MYKIFNEKIDIFKNQERSFIYEEKNCLDIINQIKKYLKIENNGNGNIILLEGDLGSGKTTFARIFINSYNNHFLVTSPTYNYINRFQINDKGFFINHFDLYRLKSVCKLEPLGLLDFINSDYEMCIIEWPELIKEYLEDQSISYLLLKFNYNNNEQNRIITIE